MFTSDIEAVAVCVVLLVFDAVDLDERIDLGIGDLK